MTLNIEHFGAINTEWAFELANHGGMEIWEYNGTNAEELGGDIDLAALGGLVVQISDVDKPITPEERREVRSRRTIIDLAFEEPSYTTSTSLLLSASESQRIAGSYLSQQLRLRSEPTSLHGGNETWHIPVSAILLVEKTRTS